MSHNQRVQTNLFAVKDLVVSRNATLGHASAADLTADAITTDAITTDGLVVGGDTELVQGARLTLATDVVRVGKVCGEVIVEDLSIATSIVMTDADTDGGFGSMELVTLPESVIILLGALLELSLSGGEGIAATATVAVAVGSAAEAADGTLSGTSGTYIASSDCVLAASAGDMSAAGTLSTLGVIDARAGTSKLYLNLGLADAGISIDQSEIAVTGSLRLIYLDLSQGAV